MLWKFRRAASDAGQSHKLVACPPQAEIATNLPEEGLLIVVQAIAEAVTLDMSRLAQRLPREEDQDWFALWPGEHYAFLKGLARTLRPTLVLDIGTYHGASALAMADHSTRIISYDVIPITEISGGYIRLTSDFTNVEQRIGDLAQEDFYQTQQEVVCEADVVMVDGPKDGIFEYEVVPKLLLNMKPGSLLILDDIRFENMQKLWRNLAKPRIDVGCFAHSSGAGVVFV